MSWLGFVPKEEKEAAERRASEEERRRKDTERQRDDEKQRREKSEMLAQRREDEKDAATKKATEEERRRLAAEVAKNEERIRREAADQKAKVSENLKEQAEQTAWQESQKRAAADKEKEEERRRREEGEQLVRLKELEKADADKKAWEESQKRVMAEKETEEERHKREKIELEKQKAEEKALEEARQRAAAEKEKYDEKRLREESEKLANQRQLEKTEAEKKAWEESQKRAAAEREKDQERRMREESEELAKQRELEKEEAEKKVLEVSRQRDAAEKEKDEERRMREESERLAKQKELEKEEAEKKAWEESRQRSVAEQEKAEEKRMREESERVAKRNELEKEEAEKKLLEESQQRTAAEQEKEEEIRLREESQFQKELEKSNAESKQEELKATIQSLTPKPEAFRDVCLEVPVLEARKRKIMETKPFTRDVPYMNILLLGLVGHGKTSFVNTVYSTLAGNVLALCPVGTAEKTLTRQFRKHTFRIKNDKDLASFRLCDTMGVEGNDGILERDLSAIMDGHIRDKYTFNPLQPIDDKNERYLKNPTLKDKIHCVGICVNAAKLSILTHENAPVSSPSGQEMDPVQKLKRIKNEVNEKGLSFIVILTTIDALCPMVCNDPSKALHSEKIEQAVRDTANIFGVPANQVFPVKNYEKEIDCVPAISSMAIHACQKMIDYANAYLENEKIDDDELKYLQAKPEPFRDMHLTNAELDLRKQKVMKTKPFTNTVPYINILLLGLVGHGKTSFVNTVYSTLVGNVLAPCPVGTGEKSLTKEFRKHRFRLGDGEDGTQILSFFRLCDTMGVEGNEGILEQDLSAIMDGHIRDKYKFNPLQPIDPTNERYLKNPTLKDKIHCVGMCVNAAKLAALNPEKSSEKSYADLGMSPMQKLKYITHNVNAKGLSFIIILTNIDGLCELVHRDPSQTFHSLRIEEAVRDAANLFGVPENQVYPVKNYDKEIACIPAISSMAIHACQKMIDYANAYLENEDCDDEDMKYLQGDDTPSTSPVQEIPIPQRCTSHTRQQAVQLARCIGTSLQKMPSVLTYGVQWDTGNLHIECKANSRQETYQHIMDSLKNMIQIDELKDEDNTPSLKLFMHNVQGDLPITQSGRRIYINPVNEYSTITAALIDETREWYIATAHHGIHGMEGMQYNFSLENGRVIGNGVAATGRNNLVNSDDTSVMDPEIPQTDLILIKCNPSRGHHIKTGVPNAQISECLNLQTAPDEMYVQFHGGASGYQRGKIFKSEFWARCGSCLPQGSMLIDIRSQPGDSGALMTTIPQYGTCKAISSVVGEYTCRSHPENPPMILSLPVEPALRDFSEHLGRNIYFQSLSLENEINVERKHEGNVQVHGQIRHNAFPNNWMSLIAAIIVGITACCVGYLYYYIQ